MPKNTRVPKPKLILPTTSWWPGLSPQDFAATVHALEPEIIARGVPQTVYKWKDPA